MALLFKRKEGAPPYIDNITLGEHPNAVLAVSLLDDDAINEVSAVFRVYHDMSMLEAKGQTTDNFSTIFTETGDPSYAEVVAALKGPSGEIDVSQEAFDYALESMEVHERGAPVPLGEHWQLEDADFKNAPLANDTETEAGEDIETEAEEVPPAGEEGGTEAEETTPANDIETEVEEVPPAGEDDETEAGETPPANDIETEVEEVPPTGEDGETEG